MKSDEPQDRTPIPTFSEYFHSQPHSEVPVFPNLGGGAVMVVPRPAAPVELELDLAF